MKEMRIQSYAFKKLIGLLSIMFLLIVIIYSISIDFNIVSENSYSKRMEINIKNRFTTSNQPKLLTYRQFDKLKKYPMDSVSITNEIDSFLETERSGYPVKVVLSGEELDNFINIHMVKGAFLNSDQNRLGSKVAVISETLVQKLFLTDYVLGNEIYILGMKYKIVGIFKDDSSIFSLLSSDGVERVYIPFESMPNYTQLAINTVYVKDSRLQQNPFSIESLDDILKKLNVNIDLYKVSGYSKSSVFISQPFSVFILFIGILIILSILRYFLKFIKLVFCHFNALLKDRYFLEMLAVSKLKILFIVFVSALFPLSIGIIYNTIKFNGFIPYEFIPGDNVFDFGFYLIIIKQAINNANNFAGYIPTKLELLFKVYILTTYILFLFLVIIFVFINNAIKLQKSLSDTNSKSLLALAVSIVSGVTAGSLLCMICGVTIDIPVKQLVIVIIYFCNKAIKADQTKFIDSCL